MSMNRQLRRAQEKQEKKVEREKQERRDERKKRLEALRRQRQKQRDSAAARREAAKSGDAKPVKSDASDADRKPQEARPAAGRRDPGRFSGALAIATVFFILLQAAVPTPTERFLDTIVKAGFYLMLGYFMTMWLTRRGQQNSVMISLIAGFALLAGTWLGAFVRPEIELDVLALILGLPLLLGGVWLGRLVSSQAPSQ